MKKQLITELIYVVATLLVATGLYVYFFGLAALGNDTLDINIHDTYIIFERTLIILLFCLLLYSLVNVFRQFSLKFKNRTANVMLIVACLLSGLDISRYIQLVSMMLDESITIYPPLSAIPDASPSPLILIIIFYSLWAIEIFLGSLVILAFVMILRNRRSGKGNH